MQLQIDRYEVQRLIGQGAMGKIYLARDPKLGRDVAIKVLNAGVAEDETRERFRMEARAIAALRHPNIVELYDYSGAQAEDLFLVMEYVPGRTLHDHVSERGAMSEVTTLSIGHELVLALEHAHQQNVVHRDLKPENVLLYNGRVVLTDFGIVKQIAAEGDGLATEITGHLQVLGTPGFMAPEQFAGEDIVWQTDIFALGALLYNLATGHVPFAGDSIIEVSDRTRAGRFDDLRDHNPLLSAGFCDLVSRCLKVKLSERFGTASEVREVGLAALRAHGVTEVRREIVNYERHPRKYAIDQLNRSLGVLDRDLKIAVRERDERGAQLIIRRMQTIAPLTKRLRRIRGIRWGSDGEAYLRALPKSRWWLWLGGGLGVGGVLGFLGALTVLAMGGVPTSVMVWFEKLADWLGYGY